VKANPIRFTLEEKRRAQKNKMQKLTSGRPIQYLSACEGGRAWS
jgi:hypothetical protein